MNPGTTKHIGAHVTGATPQVHSLCLVPYAIWAVPTIQCHCLTTKHVYVPQHLF